MENDNTVDNTDWSSLLDYYFQFKTHSLIKTSQATITQKKLNYFSIFCHVILILLRSKDEIGSVAIRNLSHISLILNLPTSSSQSVVQQIIFWSFLNLLPTSTGCQFLVLLGILSMEIESTPKNAIPSRPHTASMAFCFAVLSCKCTFNITFCHQT